MTAKVRKVISVILTFSMLISLVAVMGVVNVSAATPTVTIESFMRGAQTDLRSSELLIAKVEGYEGNPLDLTYEWTSSLGTYLYVYNSHNMYTINNTDGEIEIYNSDKDIDSSANMAGRSYDRSFSGEGFAYAAVYGANLNTSSSLVGTVTVTVKDAKGNVIGTDSHTGTVERKRVGFRWKYTYHGFVNYDLDGDLENVAFGIFEGNTRNVKDLLGESAVVHLTCEECTVNNGAIKSGSDYISLEKRADGDYYITGLKAGTSTSGGDGVVTITLEKGNCKFHNDSSATHVTTVYVYKKPVPTPTTTTITLAADSIDSRCTYYIHGVEGTKQADGSIIFTGLTPNTDYEIEVMGKTTDTDASYAYVYTKTLPVFNANIEVYLNGSYDTTTATASGTLVDIKGIDDTDNILYLKEMNGTEFIQLNHTSTGKYSVSVPNGNYVIYKAASDDAMLCDQIITVDGADRTRYLFYYTVDYDANGGTGAPAREYFHEGHGATVSTTVPTREGYIFLGWKDAAGNLYQPGDVLTNDIERAYVLTAQWEKDIKANVNLKVVVNHQHNDGIDPNVGGNLTTELTYRTNSNDPYVEVVGQKKIFDDWFATGTRVDNVTTVEYDNIYADLSGKPEYMANVFIDHYEVIDSEVTKTTDAEGNSTYDVVVYLEYNPDLFMLTYNTVAHESVPDELIPQATDIQILNWNARIANAWSPISRHVDNSVDVRFVGRNGSGNYGVPVYNNGDTAYYRVNAAGLTLADGTEILLETEDGHNYYSVATNNLAAGAYYATVEVKDGADIDGTNLDGAHGVYILDLNGSYVQQGEIIVTVYVNRYDVIFNSNGGSAVATIEDQFTVPDVSGYVPTKNGYTFAGWFTDAALTTSVTAGTVMSSDVTLYAKWNENKTVEGTVTVAGTYELNGKTVVIYEKDRAKHVDALLQVVDTNGYSHTVEVQRVEITYGADNMGTGTYKFENIPNDGKAYRVKVMNTNYGELYQNEKSASTVVTDYAAYDAAHFMAEFGADTTAVVNAYLPFDSAVFDLKYELDATAINDGFRPTSIGTLILGDDGSGVVNPLRWTVIAQQFDGTSYDPQDTALNGGLGSNSYPVWTSMYDGTTLYDYAIRVHDYVMGGAETLFDSDAAPFMIHYNGTARYSAVSGQTQILKATLVPKMYTITFDVNAGEDEITGMDSYLMADDTYKDTYYWSFGKAITAKPVRTGYKFLGWYDANGNEVTAVAPEMAENITVVAKWEELKVEQYVSDYAYIFGYNDSIMGAEGPLLRSEVSAMVHRLVKQNGKLGDFVYDAANPSFADIAGEWFQSGIEYVHHQGGFKAAEGTNVYPYAQVTRGEAFKIVALGLGFTEDTTLSNQQYAELLQSLGYLVGDENGNLNAGSFITRAEFCTLYNRIIGRQNAVLEDKDGNVITAETYGFTDMTDSSVWYYADMVRATSAYKDGFVDIELRGIRNVLDDYAG